MKEMRRLLALVLCIVMLVGIVPAGVFATETDVPAEEPAITDLGEKGSAEPTESAPMPGATPVLVEESEDAPVLAADGETPIDAAVIFSDLHTRSNDGISDYTGDVSKHRYTEAGALLTGIMGGIKQLGLPVSTVSSAGDAFAVDNDGDYSGGKGKFIGYTSVLNGYIRSALEDNDLPIYYVWTDHDRYAKAEDNTIDLPKDSRFVYGAGEDDIYGNADDDNYYIFLLSILDTSTNERYGIQPRSATEVEASIESFLDVAEDLDTTKPLFIVAHQPLLDKRNDNGYAYKWWTAIDSIAKGMDVAYFYGHNHNYDDSSYYYYGVGDTMAVCTNSSGASTNVTMSFAHINAGYMNPTTGTDKPSTRTGVAVGALIYEDRIEYKTYRATGVDTQTLKLAKSQDRAFIIKTVECEIGNGDTVTATSQALTAVTAEWNYVDLSETLDVETAAAYDVAVEGYIQGDIQVEMEVGYVSAQNLKLYFVGEGGALTEIAPTSVVATETGVKVAFTATSPAFTVAVGNPPVAVPEDAVLESLTVVAPEKTNYFDSDEEEVEGVGTVISLNITGMVVTANYVNGAETYSETLEWDRWGQVEGGYSLSFEGLAPGDYGEKTVTVSYGGKTATFTVWVCPTSVVVEGEENITASFDAPGVMAMTATKVTDEETYEAVALLLELLVDGELTILDFQPTYANGDTALDGKARVTMPIPEGLTKPVVYFVSDDGSTYEKMPTTVNTADNTLTFETTHFSKYVVGDEGSVPSIEVEPETVPVNKSEQINKPVYLLVTGNPTGNVLIANSNSGSGYLLKNNNGQVDDINVVIQSANVDNDADLETFIELDDTAGLLWTVGTSSSKYTFKNGSYYLYPSSSGLRLDTGNRSWTYDSNKLYYSSSRYLTYDGDKWAQAANSNSASNIYFYTATTVNYTETVKGIYSIAPTQAKVGKVALAGETVTLGSTLTFKPDSGTATTTDVSETATYSVVTTDKNGKAVDGDPNGIIAENGINKNVITLSGNTGVALIKVSYDTNGDAVGGVVTNYITLVARTPHHYSVVLHANENNTLGEEIVDTISLKNVRGGDKYSLWAVIRGHSGEQDTVGIDLGDVEDDRIRWSLSESGIATIDPATGIITFTGKRYGTFEVTATYLDEYGSYLAHDTVELSVTDTEYIVPGDGTNDFPAYPAEGSVRFDKTATAVGNYSETGLAKVELSFTGVPYGRGVDVVVVIDTSSSMSKSVGGKTRYAVMKESLENMLEQFASVDKNGAKPDIHLAIIDFNGFSTSTSQKNSDNYIPHSNVAKDSTTDRTNANAAQVYTNKDHEDTAPYILNVELGANHFEDVGSDAFDDDRIAEIMARFTKEKSGTNYDFGIQAAYELLAAKKAANEGNKEIRDQYMIFLTDGAPFRYNGFTANNSDGRTEMDKLLNGGYADKAALQTAFSYMTDAVLEMYNPVNGTHPHRMAEAIKGDPGTTYWAVDATATTYVKDGVDTGSYLKPYNGLGAKIYSIGFCIADDTGDTDGGVIDEETSKKVIRTISSGEGYYWENTTSAEQLKNAFTAIAGEIRKATNVEVEDKIGNNYTVSFAMPSGVTVDDTDGLSDFYMQVVSYTLNDQTHERTGTPVVLENFTFGADGKIKSHTADDGTNCGTGCTHVTFTNGVVTALTGTYFRYKSTAEGEFINWTAAEISKKELALQYVAYLDKSAGYEGDDATPAGTYYTNEYATLTYDNVFGHRVQQEFPLPRLTWNGAQVSYVFYLVNEKGQPVTKEGEIVPFAEAVYVTDVHTTSVIWNDLEEATGLEAKHLAENLVPDVYELYDPEAKYNVHVYEDEDAVNLNNHFVIDSAFDGTDDGKYTTYVFNTKADASKYTVPGAYIANDGNSDVVSTKYLCKGSGAVNAKVGVAEGIDSDSKFNQGVYYIRHNDGTYELAPFFVEGTVYYKILTASYTAAEGEEQWVPDNGESYTGGTAIKDNSGKISGIYYLEKDGTVYTIVRKSDATEVHSGFDFSNTTVAFAVMWKPELVEDTVVVDFGLDVVVNVIQNDNMAVGAVGVRSEAPKVNGIEVKLNEGTYDADKEQSAVVKIDTDGDNQKDMSIGTATVESLTSVRFSLDKENGMKFAEPVVFYYEADVTYYENYNPDAETNKLTSTSMYSKVTVIPATTVYYEDEYVTLKTYTKGYSEVGTVSKDYYAQNVLYTATYNKASEYEQNVTYYSHTYSPIAISNAGEFVQKLLYTKDGDSLVAATSYDSKLSYYSVVKETIEDDVAFEKSGLLYFLDDNEYTKASEYETNVTYYSITEAYVTSAEEFDQFLLYSRDGDSYTKADGYDSEADYFTYKMYSKDTSVNANNFAEKDRYTITSYSRASKYGQKAIYFSAYTPNIGWAHNSVAATQTQEVDRPGADKVGGTYDADNIYGYDPVYENSSQYSLGNSAWTTITADSYATAEFEFYGTGFDVISMTSNTTGTIVTRIYKWNGSAYEDVYLKSVMVDTYFSYGYVNHMVTYTYNAETQEWDRTVGDATDEDIRAAVFPENSENGTEVTAVERVWERTPNGLYQVPVIKIKDLPYGRYKAVINSSYLPMFDHEDNGSYDFYLDAIRIYDPTGVVSGETENDEGGVVSGAYAADGELYPEYEELRNHIIAHATFAEFFEVANITAFEEGKTYFVKNVNGRFTVVPDGESLKQGTVYYTMAAGVNVDGVGFITSTFIDGEGNIASMDDYINYGPNNEVYLAQNQAVAAFMNAPEKNGYKTHVYLGIKSVGGNASVEVYGMDANGVETMAVQEDLSTATDMYYDITALNGKTVVIRNSGESGILSITNVKVAYEAVKTEGQAVTVNASGEEEAMFTVNSETLKLALLSLRAPVEEETINPDATAPEEEDPDETDPDDTESDETDPDENDPGENNPDETDPDENDPDENDPSETEPTETVPAPTEPEVTEPEEQESIQETVQDIIDIIRDIIGIIGSFFSGWF